MADIPISDVLRRAVFTGSVGTGPYSCTFEILDETDIAVYFNDALLTLTTDYTVAIAGNGTFQVTLVVGSAIADTPDADDEVAVVGAKSIERTTDFATGGDFFAATMNTELDNVVIFCQQLYERTERTLRGNVSDATDLDMSLPAVPDRASKYLAFGVDGAPVATAGTTSEAVISTFAETFLDDETAAEVLTTLGFSAYLQTLLNDDDAAAARATLGAVGLTGNETVAGVKSIADSNLVIVGSDDATKKVRLEVDGLTANTTRVITMPDANVTLPTTNFNANQNANTIFAGPASGAAAAPTFRAPVGVDGASLVLLSSQEASDDATIDFTSVISTTYDSYELRIINLAPASDATDVQILGSVDNGANFLSTNIYSHGRSVSDSAAATTPVAAGAAATDRIVLASSLGNATDEVFSARVTFNRSSGGRTIFSWQAGYVTNSGSWAQANGSGIISTDDINAIRVFMSSGNITSGKFQLYGLRSA